MESAELVTEYTEHSDINRASQNGTKLNDPASQDLPEHLQRMYEDNISDLLVSEKLQFKELLLEYQDVFSTDDFDLGCLSSRVEHKIKTHDEIPIAETFRRTPLHFQKQEQEYIEKLLKHGVLKLSVSEWSAPPVPLHGKKNCSVSWILAPDIIRSHWKRTRKKMSLFLQFSMDSPPHGSLHQGSHVSKSDDSCLTKPRMGGSHCIP